MTRYGRILAIGLLSITAIGLSPTEAAKPSKGRLPASAPLSEKGKQLEAKYAALLAELKTEITRAIPAVDADKLAALVEARNAANGAEAHYGAAGSAADRVKTLTVAMGYWKKFGISAATAKIEKLEAAVETATNDAQSVELKKQIETLRQSREKTEQKISSATAEIAKLTPHVAASAEAKEAAKAALTRARATETAAAEALVSSVGPFLASDKHDAELVKCALVAWATPQALAAFAQQGSGKEALVEKLLADHTLMKEMLLAGGAKRGNFGQAMQTYGAIQKASPRAGEGVLQRLALATSLELASPIATTRAKAPAKNEDGPDESDASNVDPVKRYLAYEKAYLDGELDPAFKNFSTWELRMVVDGNAPDEILQWGRDMIRNYRPDLVTMANYGWRYSALVKSDVRYGSDGVKNDRPELNEYQNILKDGGVCGRRAFFGRFILRANGIPVWGVTQHKHAALSHWTPKGWVVNLGAGFEHSWWDKGDVPTSGRDFLLETQARRHPEDYLKVARAHWISRVLGEEAYNGRRNIAGGTWSSIAHFTAKIIASQEVELGPLGQELAEANGPDEGDDTDQATVTKDDRNISVDREGTITIPVVAHGKATGSGVAMKSHGGGMQVLGSAGFKVRYEFEAPRAGTYAVSARVVTVHEGRRFSFAINDGKAVEVAAPYTIGMWQGSKPVDLVLQKGRNVLVFEIHGGGKMAIKDFTLCPVK